MKVSTVATAPAEVTKYSERYDKGIATELSVSRLKNNYITELREN